MPVEVVTAVDAALAAEAGAADAAPGSLTAGRTVTPLPTGRDRSPVTMRLLQAAAVVVLLLAGLGIGISALGGGGDSDSSTAGGADSATADKAAESGAYPLTASGRDWTADAVTLDAAEAARRQPRPAGGCDSLREQFSAQAEDDAGSGGSADPTASAPARAAPESAARLASGPALAQCVAELAGGPVTPLAVDISTWQQQPAAVIVLPAPGEPSPGRGVGRRHRAARPTDAKLLYYANLPR